MYNLSRKTLFTGIIEETGKVATVSRSGGSLLISIGARRTAQELDINDSVAVNGVCQTVIEKRGELFVVQAVEETLRKTTLGSLKPSSLVNLELPLRVGDRLDGHFVQGHVDCVGTLVSMETRESSWLVTVRIPEEFKRNVVPIGSIALDGVSLTIASVHDCDIAVSIIPHTMDKTIFPTYQVGTNVNLEFDIIGKYVTKQFTADDVKETLSHEKLKKWGYEEG